VTPSVWTGAAKRTRAVTDFCPMMSAIDSMNVRSPTNDISRHSVPSACS
jgi:hypothetical protein